MPEPDYPAMVDLVYPVGLPAPHASTVQPSERRLLSDLQSGPQQVRAVQRDYLGQQQLEWVLSAAEADRWRAWFEEDLQHGGAWFSADDWPAPHRLLGGIARRFMGAPQWQFIASGMWRITGRCQLRGATRPPKVPGCIPWQPLGEPPAAHPPVVFGSGAWCAQDPVSGLVWSMWRSSGGGSAPTALPEGGPDLDGTYVLVYDPFTLELVDHIGIGSGGVDTMNLVHFAGSVYAACEGNSISIGLPVMTKIDAASRAIVDYGSTSYEGVVSKFGHVSRDGGQLYLSVSNGVGAGTFAMTSADPFTLTLGVANEDWVYCSIFNPFSGSRAYAGYGAWLDLHAANGDRIAVDVSGVFTGGSGEPQSARLAYKTCTPYIYMIQIGWAGVIMVHTLTGEISPISATFWPTAMYYSPESDTLYVEGAEPRFSAPTVRAYQGTTFELIDELPDYVVADGEARGNAIYIGDETFIACESTSAPTSRMWRVSFPH